MIWLRGECDLDAASQLRDTLLGAISTGTSDVVVDASQVTFVDAATIGVLIAARNALRSQSRHLTLRAPSERVLRVLDLCGLGQLAGDGSPLTHPIGR